VVKTLRPHITGGDAAMRLLREAWITGALEHPNVVPVHDLVVDERGCPVIVLKRIEGVTWTALIRDPARAVAETRTEDALEAHLGIFSQVCNALSLAHVRGIIHRDVKPDNVMVGAFGEVYLVDWGIAVSLRDDGGGRFPLAANATEISGTPAYMAPEMLGGAAPRIDERTDVYLLGAVLFEILTGRAPHEGGDLRTVIASILSSSIVLPATAPEELASICRKAMSPSPRDRHQNVDELRTAVASFLRHRGSATLAADTTVRLVELRRLIASAPLASADGAARVYNVFGECRFGFKQALRAWPENPTAIRGHREACEAMVRLELASGSPEKAAVTLLEIDAPSAELVRAVKEASQAKSEERENAERIRHQFDPAIGRSKRAVWGGLMGLFFTCTPMASRWFEIRGGGPTSSRTLRDTLSSFVFACILLAIGRRSLDKTPVNRRIAFAVLFTFAAQFALELGGRALHVPPDGMIVCHFFLWFVIAGMTAITVDRRVAPAAIAYLLAFLYLSYNPEHRWYVMVLANFTLSVNLFVAWARFSPKPGGEP
jgi:serine/threonine-protein kinase